MTFTRAKAALVQRDHASCLAALLEVWRESRDGAVAELIERVGEAAPAEPISSKRIAAAIDKRIATATDADVTTICDVVLREVRTIPKLYTALVRLAATRQPDPRIASALAHLVDHPPFKQTDGALYGDIVEALDAIDDPRFRPVIARSWARIEPRMRHLRKEREDGEILKRVAAAVAARAAPPETNLAKQIAEVDALLGTKSVTPQAQDSRALLQTIYDDPLDTSLRLVYADALLEAGDPRGELIALQCNRGDGRITKRERELLKLYARTWLGPIEPCVLKSGLAYRRGFVACVRECANMAGRDEMLAAPEWSTVETIDRTFVWGDAAQSFFADRRWKALREVWGISGEDLRVVASRRDDLPWTALGVKAVGNWADLVSITSLPALTELAIADSYGSWSAMIALAGSPLARSLRRIRVWQPSERDELATIVGTAREAGLELDIHVEWCFAGDQNGELLRITGDHGTAMVQAATPALRRLTRIVTALPPRTLRTLSFGSRAKITDEAWAPFAAALVAHGVEPPPKP